MHYHYSHTIIIINKALYSYIIIPTHVHKALLYSTNHYRGTKLSWLAKSPCWGVVTERLSH